MFRVLKNFGLGATGVRNRENSCIRSHVRLILLGLDISRNVNSYDFSLYVMAVSGFPQLMEIFFKMTTTRVRGVSVIRIYYVFFSKVISLFFVIADFAIPL